ncbi:MAG: class I SAM-dependent methyltransferase, partial [Candidatus Helarchaeota archaeon]
MIIILFIIVLIVLGLSRVKISRIKNIEGFDSPEVAKAFEKQTKLLPFRLLYKRVISELKKLDPKGTVADVGCGAANVLIRLANKYPNLKLIGIDVSQEILNKAIINAEKANVKDKIVFRVGSVEKLPLDNQSLNYIISTLSLHHWNAPIDAFKEFYRTLKPGGVMIIFDFRRDLRKFFYGFLKFITKVIVPKPLKKINEPLGSVKSSYTINEINELLEKSSFENYEIKPFLAWMFIIAKK